MTKRQIEETLNEGKEAIQKSATTLSVEEALKATKNNLRCVQPMLDYNAKALLSYVNHSGTGRGRIKESYLAQNRTLGAKYLSKPFDPNNPDDNEVLTDTTSPEFRANIITNRFQLEEIFPGELPEVNFENEIVVATLFTVNYKGGDHWYQI